MAEIPQEVLDLCDGLDGFPVLLIMENGLISLVVVPPRTVRAARVVTAEKIRAATPA